MICCTGVAGDAVCQFLSQMTLIRGEYHWVLAMRYSVITWVRGLFLRERRWEVIPGESCRGFLEYFSAMLVVGTVEYVHEFVSNFYTGTKQHGYGIHALKVRSLKYIIGFFWDYKTVAVKILLRASTNL